MKAFVNGQEVDLAEESVEIAKLTDRMIVKTAEGAFSAVAVRQGDAVLVSFKGQLYKVERKLPRAVAAAGSASGELRALMPGAIVDVLVEEGASVSKGEKILVLEAMKTQQAFLAPFAGRVDKIAVGKGDQVTDTQLLAVVTEA